MGMWLFIHANDIHERDPSQWKAAQQLNHYGLVTPYGDRELGQHWFG